MPKQHELEDQPRDYSSLESIEVPTEQKEASALTDQLVEIQESYKKMNANATAVDVTIARASRVVKESYHSGHILPVAVGTRLIETAYYRGLKIGKLEPSSRLKAEMYIKDGKSLLMGYRESILEEFAQDSNNDDIWGKIFTLVGAEADIPARWIAGGRKLRKAIADDIPGSELIELAKKVRITDPEDRYRLMTSKASNGEVWFDVLKTFSSPQLEAAEATILDEILGNEEGARFKHALDLGTGTGKSLLKLEARANRVTGFDREGSLLELAQLVAGERTDLVQGEVDELPFEDESFDLISSTGLSGALDRVTATAFFRELARVLTGNGTYIDGSYSTSGGSNFMGEEMSRITATARATLTDMIVDTVSSKFERIDHLHPEEREDILDTLGLEEEEHFVTGEGGITTSAVRVIRKQ